MPKKLLAAMAAAGLCATIASPALTQNATATTPGGDVTADEATPLPPIVVQSPSEPIRRKGRRSGSQQASAPVPGLIVEETDGFEGVSGSDRPSVGAFTLGQLDMIGGSSVTNEAMWTYNKQSLDDAVSIIPGVTVHTTGGSRNERDIYVRGFDRFRVPLYMDGVRIYLPADNRLDMSRFLTPDLAEIQVQKGYVSVLNGPGGLGGAINLVSRKPTKEIELEGRAGLVTNGDISDLNRWSSYAYAGTRQQGYYAQVSGTIVDQNHFNLSEDFHRSPFASGAQIPAFVNYPYEDGGKRENSEFEDWSINAKVGITPNATDEYVINFTTQAGQKSAPLNVDGQRIQGPRYWQWPTWDVMTVSWLSKTQIDPNSYVKTNAYYNTFDSLLSSFSDPNYSTQPRFNQDFNSYYKDYAFGGFIEAGTKLSSFNTLKGAIHYRRDSHSERSDIAIDRSPGAGGPVNEPWHESIVDTWSFAVENTFHVTRAFDIVTGISYDTESVGKAEEFNSNTRVLSRSPEPSSEAWNWQGAGIYRFSDTGTVHASVSSRTRFPTLFDRYSTRFDTRLANPFIDPERSTNYELGWNDSLTRSFRASASVFYSDLKDSIQNVYVAASGGSAIIGVNADGEHYGFELSADWDIMPGLRVGGNYTYLERSLDFAGAVTAEMTAAQRRALSFAQVENTPQHEAFIYLSWQATDRLTLTPSLELASDRSSLITSHASTLLGATPYPNYAKVGSYARLNFQAEYSLTDNASLAVGATNLFDQDYSLAEGFPEPGRQFYANARVKF